MTQLFGPGQIVTLGNLAPMPYFAKPRNSAQGVIIDTCNRADNASSLGAADTGQLWQQLNGVAGISSNQAYSPGGNTGGYTETGYSDGRVQLSLPVNAGGARVIGRLTDANNYIYLSVGTTSVLLVKVVNGSPTTIRTITVNSPTSTFALVFIGSLLVVQIDGITVSSDVDNFNQYATKVGFRLQGTSDRADNFIFTPFTTLISDGFNRPDGALGNADTGQAWVTSGTPLVISGGKAVWVSSSGYNFIDSGVADGDVSANISFTSAAIRMIFRYADTSNYFYIEELSSTSIRIVKRVIGVTTVLAVSGTLTITDGDNFRVTFIGNIIRVYQNGTSIISLTDNALVNATKHGMEFYNAGSFDNFSFKSASVVAYDRFNRGDSPSLGKAETGQIWGGSGAYAIASNQATNGGAGVTAYVETGLTNGVMRYKTVNTRADAMYPVNNSINGYGLVTSNGLNKYAGGSGTVLGSGSSYSANDVAELLADGTTYIARKNGAYLTAAADNVYSGGTLAGFRNGSGSGRLWDDFQVSILPSPNLYDSFNRADSASTLGTSDSGQAWTAVSGTWGVNSNRAYSVTNSINDRAFIDTGLLDYVLSVTINGDFTSGGVYALPQVMLRRLDDSNYMYLQPYNGNIGLIKVDTGSTTSLALTATTLTSSTDYVLTVIASGANISIYKDGVSLISYTLTGGDLTKYNGSTATGTGFFISKGGSPTVTPKWDNLKVRAL